MSFWIISEKESIEPRSEPRKSILNSDKIYTYSQKFILIKWNLSCYILSIISSIIQIVMLFSGYWNIGFGKTYCIILIICSFCYEIASFLLNIYLVRHEFKEMKEFCIFLNLKMVSILFIFSSLFSVAKMVMIVIVLLHFRYFSNYGAVEIVVLTLLIIDMICLIYSIFVYFILEGSKISCKILLYFSGIILIILCFFIVYSTQKILDVFALENELNTLIINYSFKGVMRISIIFIFAIEIIFLFSLRKFQTLLLVSANSTLLLTVLLALLNGVLIKNLHQISEYFTQPGNCINALKYLNEQYLTTVGCDNKYLESDNSPYLQCSLNEQAFIWETPYNWSKNACINTNCCDMPLSIIYYSDIMIVYMLSLSIIGIGFIIMACSYYLGGVYDNLQGEYLISNRINNIMMIFYIIVPIIGILSLLYVPKVLPEKQQLFPTIYQSFNENIKQYSSNATDYQLSCFLISEYLSNFNPKLSTDKCLNNYTINGTNTCFDDIRVVLLIENGAIDIPLDYNDEGIKIFDKRSKLLVYPQTTDFSSFDYLAFQGSVNNTKLFMQNVVKVCPSSLFQTIKYTYNIYQISESSKIILSSSNHDVSLIETHKTSSIPQNFNNSTDSSNNNNSNNFTITTINFNLTANTTYHIIGELFNDIYIGLEGCTVCFTQDNPEMGVEYECLINSMTDENGVFDLEMNQLIGKVQFEGYLQFFCLDYFPLQIERFFSSNQENVINLGYIKMNSMNLTTGKNSSNQNIDKKSIISTSNTSSSSSISDTILLIESQLNNVKFGDLNINIMDMLTFDPLSLVSVTLYKETVSCKNNLQVQAIGSFVTEFQNPLTFYNLEYNTYTFFASKMNYKTNCIEITINSHKKNETILLSPNLQTNQVRIQFQWTDINLSLGLFLMYKSNDNKTKCVVSYQNKECEGVNMITHRGLNGSNFDIINIESWQNLNYLIYFKELISEEKYQQRTQNNEYINKELLYYSNIIVRYYVNELDLPAETLNTLSINQSYNLTELLEEENLAYLLFCLQGGISNVATIPEKSFWITSNYDKPHGQQYPESDICVFK